MACLPAALPGYNAMNVAGKYVEFPFLRCFKCVHRSKLYDLPAFREHYSKKHIGTAERNVKYICKGCNKQFATDFHGIYHIQTSAECKRISTKASKYGPKARSYKLNMPHNMDLDDVVQMETAVTIALIIAFRELQSGASGFNDTLLNIESRLSAMPFWNGISITQTNKNRSPKSLLPFPLTSSESEAEDGFTTSRAPREHKKINNDGKSMRLDKKAQSIRNSCENSASFSSACTTPLSKSVVGKMISETVCGFHSEGSENVRNSLNASEDLKSAPNDFTRQSTPAVNSLSSRLETYSHSTGVDPKNPNHHVPIDTPSECISKPKGILKRPSIESEVPKEVAGQSTTISNNSKNCTLKMRILSRARQEDDVDKGVSINETSTLEEKQTLVGGGNIPDIRTKCASHSEKTDDQRNISDEVSPRKLDLRGRFGKRREETIRTENERLREELRNQHRDEERRRIDDKRKIEEEVRKIRAEASRQRIEADAKRKEETLRLLQLEIQKKHDEAVEREREAAEQEHQRRLLQIETEIKEAAIAREREQEEQHRRANELAEISRRAHEEAEKEKERIRLLRAEEKQRRETLRKKNHELKIEAARKRVRLIEDEQRRASQIQNSAVSVGIPQVSMGIQQGPMGIQQVSNLQAVFDLASFVPQNFAYVTYCNSIINSAGISAIPEHPIIQNPDGGGETLPSTSPPTQVKEGYPKRARPMLSTLTLGGTIMESIEKTTKTGKGGAVRLSDSETESDKSSTSSPDRDADRWYPKRFSDTPSATNFVRDTLDRRSNRRRSRSRSRGWESPSATRSRALSRSPVRGRIGSRLYSISPRRRSRSPAVRKRSWSPAARVYCRSTSKSRGRRSPSSSPLRKRCRSQSKSPRRRGRTRWGSRTRSRESSPTPNIDRSVNTQLTSLEPYILLQSSPKLSHPNKIPQCVVQIEPPDSPDFISRPRTDSAFTAVEQVDDLCRSSSAEMLKNSLGIALRKFYLNHSVVGPAANDLPPPEQNLIPATLGPVQKVNSTGGALDTGPPDDTKRLRLLNRYRLHSHRANVGGKLPVTDKCTSLLNRMRRDLRSDIDLPSAVVQVPEVSFSAEIESDVAVNLPPILPTRVVYHDVAYWDIPNERWNKVKEVNTFGTDWSDQEMRHILSNCHTYPLNNNRPVSDSLPNGSLECFCCVQNLSLIIDSRYKQFIAAQNLLPVADDEPECAERKANVCTLACIKAEEADPLVSSKPAADCCNGVSTSMEVESLCYDQAVIKAEPMNCEDSEN